jgi:hypothetical protein
MTVRIIGIYSQNEIGKPAELVARREHREARRMMRDAIADLKARGIALRVATEMRIVTEFGETIYLEKA